MTADSPRNTSTFGSWVGDGKLVIKPRREPYLVRTTRELNLQSTDTDSPVDTRRARSNRFQRRDAGDRRDVALEEKEEEF